MSAEQALRDGLDAQDRLVSTCVDAVAKAFGEALTLDAMTDRELLELVLCRVAALDDKLDAIAADSRKVSEFVDAMRPLLETYSTMGEQISKGGFAALGALFSRGSG